MDEATGFESIGYAIPDDEGVVYAATDRVLE